MSLRAQIAEPRSSLVLRLCLRHGVRIALVGSDAYLFGAKDKRAAAIGEVQANPRTITAELLADDVIRRAQKTARLQVVRTR